MLDATSRVLSRTLLNHAKQPDGVHEFLVFELAGEVYGVELARVKELVNLPDLTRVPRAPREVVGVFSMRGHLVTVLDLRKKMRLESRPTTRHARVICAASSSGEIVGLFVDAVKNVVRLDSTDIEMAQSIFGADLADYVLGIGRTHDEAIVLLDLGRLAA